MVPVGSAYTNGWNVPAFRSAGNPGLNDRARLVLPDCNHTFFLGYSYVFQIDQATYNNHFYLICLLSFMLILAPLHKS